MSDQQEKITTTSIWEDYRHGKDYLDTIGLSQTIPKCVDYYEGRQWADVSVDDPSYDLPRPRVNLIKFITRNKIAAVVNTPVKVIYRAEDNSDTVMENGFVSYIMDELKMKAKDKRAVGQGAKKGTYIYHFYWDGSKRGYNALISGGVNVEIIEMLDVVFANPNETDEQKQKWIIISSREELSAVKEMAKANSVDMDSVTPDESESDYNEDEQQGTDYVTVLTKYYRKDNAVYYQKSTKDTIIQQETPLTPNWKERIQKLSGETKEIEDEENSDTVPSNIDPEETGLPDTQEELDGSMDEKFYYYPIVVGNWEEREKSIYGIGEVEELMDNQDILNRDLAYYLKARRDNALGGWLVKDGALKDQEITNEPDQVLHDYTPGNGWGIKRNDAGSIPSDNLNFADLFMGMLRTVTGSSEVMTGEVLGKNMSGAAIVALQNQAMQPLEEYRERFWHVKEKQALVLMEFFKHYYYSQDFFIEDGKDKQKAHFDAKQLVGKKYDVTATAGQGSIYNEVAVQQTFDNMLDKGLITKIQRIEFMNEKILPNKEKVLENLKSEEANVINMLNAEKQQLEQQLMQAADVIKQQGEVVNSARTIINDNKNLNRLLIEVAKESIESKRVLKAKLAETYDDANAFAQQIDAEKRKKETEQGSNS